MMRSESSWYNYELKIVSLVVIVFVGTLIVVI